MGSKPLLPRVWRKTQYTARSLQKEARPCICLYGYGATVVGMGQELYRVNSVFREAVDLANEIYRAISGISIRDEMMKEAGESRIHQTQFAQPANFIVQYAP